MKTAPTINNVRNVISETQDSGHPVNDFILALLEKNKGSSRTSSVIDFESFIIDLRYSISQINKVANKLEIAFNGIK